MKNGLICQLEERDGEVVLVLLDATKNDSQFCDGGHFTELPEPIEIAFYKKELMAQLGENILVQPGCVKWNRIMKFPNGREAQVGDVFRYRDGTKGTVVCSMDLGQYSEEHPKEQWEYLGEGILAETESMGLVHYTEPDSDMVFLHGKSETLSN